MKNLYILLGVSACLLSSCLEDEGNYVYTKIQPVEITGLEDSYRFILQKDIALSPSVKTDINEADIEYIWRIGADTLANTKDLTYKFTKVPVSNDPLTFEIYNKKTDVRYPKTMSLSVVSPFTTGWLLLTEEGALAFQSFEDQKEFYQDVYSTVQGKKLEGTPVSVSQLNFQDGSTGQYLDRVSVIMKNGKSAMLDGNSMEYICSYEDQFRGFDKAPAIAFENGYWYRYFSSGTTVLVTEDGTAYGKIPSSMMYPEALYFEYPYAGDSKGYKLAPHMTGAYYANYYVGYDELNKRFIYITPSTLSASFYDVGVDASTLGECVWMGGNYNINVYSIHKSADTYNVATFAMDWSGGAYDYVKAALPAGTLDESSCYAVRSDGAYIFASRGNKLLAINVAGLQTDPASSVVELCEFEGPITAMSLDYRTGNFNVNEFAVCIQNGSTSSLLILNQDLASHGQITARYDGIQGKVISMFRKSN